MHYLALRLRVFKKLTSISDILPMHQRLLVIVLKFTQLTPEPSPPDPHRGCAYSIVPGSKKLVPFFFESYIHSNNLEIIVTASWSPNISSTKVRRKESKARPKEQGKVDRLSDRDL